jgi:hypothetical protein
LVVNILVSFGLKYVWGMVNLLQFLVFIPMWKLNFPYNALAALNYIKYIALMEFVDTKSIMNSISEGLGIEKGGDNIIENMGLMLLVGGALAVVVLLLGVSVYFFSSNFKRYKLYRSVRQRIFYNAIIRYVLQSTLKLQIASMTTLLIANWDLAKK